VQLQLQRLSTDQESTRCSLHWTWTKTISLTGLSAARWLLLLCSTTQDIMLKLLSRSTTKWTRTMTARLQKANSSKLSFKSAASEISLDKIPIKSNQPTNMLVVELLSFLSPKLMKSLLAHSSSEKVLAVWARLLTTRDTHTLSLT